VPVLNFKGKAAIETYHHAVPHHTFEFDKKLSVLAKSCWLGRWLHLCSPQRQAYLRRVWCCVLGPVLIFLLFMRPFDEPIRAHRIHVKHLLRTLSTGHRQLVRISQTNLHQYTGLVSKIRSLPKNLLTFNLLPIFCSKKRTATKKGGTKSQRIAEKSPA
jgi:hypothetical protein